MSEQLKFSDKLEVWLKSKQPKTIAGLDDLFAEKSFAVIILILMVIPALPLPTGGITHIFELIVMLLALELVAGMKKVWLPERWRRAKLNVAAEGKTNTKILNLIRWFERRSSPRWRVIMGKNPTCRLLGALIFIMSLAAFLAPPFTGLDTLPSLGVVIICLGIIFEDALIALAGLAIGLAGLGLIVSLSSLIVNYVKQLFG